MHLLFTRGTHQSIMLLWCGRGCTQGGRGAFCYGLSVRIRPSTLITERCQKRIASAQWQCPLNCVSNPLQKKLKLRTEKKWLLAGLWDLYMIDFGQWVHFEFVLGWARTVLDCFWAQVAAHVFTMPALWPSLQVSLCEFPASFSQALTNA